MASQTDKKEEFRKYLEKSNVLAILTNILTDLFEMDVKPDDPGQYLYQKFGESLNKDPVPTSQANHAQQEPNQRDTAMIDVISPTAATVENAAPKPNQDSDPSVRSGGKPHPAQTGSATVHPETEAAVTPTNPGPQAPPVSSLAPVTAPEAPAMAGNATPNVPDDAAPIGTSAQTNSAGSQAQPSDSILPPTGSLEPSTGVPVSPNAPSPRPAPASVQ